jgi:hypothetical protein
MLPEDRGDLGFDRVVLRRPLLAGDRAHLAADLLAADPEHTPASSQSSQCSALAWQNRSPVYASSTTSG